jgi:hypothetical protein
MSLFDNVFSDTPLIFKAGTSEILGQFTKEDRRQEEIICQPDNIS